MGRPPFRLTRGVHALAARIDRAIGRCEGLGLGASPPPKLRRASHVRTIQATTAIEGNRLSLAQVTAVLAGRRVAGPAREVLEVQNARAAYALADRLDGASASHLRRAHGVMMRGLAADAGAYRRGDVGILRGTRVAHVAPPAARVRTLIEDLMVFVRDDENASPLVKACVFHYELELIHPFSDGNGRIGRLWQSVLLRAHHPLLAHVPIESLVKDDQDAYYRVLRRADRAGDSTEFVSFMLDHVARATESLASELRPRREDAETRLTRALAHFGGRTFSRGDYLALHPSLSTATASRDLRTAVERGWLALRGTKATARYLSRKPRRGAESL